MSPNLTRTQFIRGQFGGQADARHARVRPPWALPESLFTQLCTGCGECVAECSRFLLKTERGTQPMLDFEAGGCNFCGDCVEACGPGALTRNYQGRAQLPWTYKARIAGACLAEQGVLCRLCGDHCEAAAIRFKLAIGGRALALIDVGTCTGCGECYRHCPPRAIALHPVIPTEQ